MLLDKINIDYELVNIDNKYKKEVSEQIRKLAIVYRDNRELKKFAICIKVLKKINACILYECKNIYELCSEWFNISSSGTAKYIKVANKFLNTDTGLSRYHNNGNDFKYMQLVELASLNFNEIDYLLKYEYINFDTPYMEIRKIKQNVLIDDETRNINNINEHLLLLSVHHNEIEKSINDLITLSKDVVTKYKLEELKDKIMKFSAFYRIVMNEVASSDNLKIIEDFQQEIRNGTYNYNNYNKYIKGDV